MEVKQPLHAAAQEGGHASMIGPDQGPTLPEAARKRAASPTAGFAPIVVPRNRTEKSET